MTFRFGVVAATARTGAEWVSLAQRAEDLGYDSLLVPDTVQTLSPFAALAAAAASTSRLRLGTYVLSAPNRAPGLVAWETRTLQLLSGGRFELGIGGGRPGAERDAVMLGMEFGTPRERLQRVADTIRAVREGPECPPILVAASKAGMLRLAAEQADVVALGLPPQSSEEELVEMVGRLRSFGGSPEVHVNVAAVAETADAIPEWVGRTVGGDRPGHLLHRSEQRVHGTVRPGDHRAHLVAAFPAHPNGPSPADPALRPVDRCRPRRVSQKARREEVRPPPLGVDGNLGRQLAPLAAVGRVWRGYPR